MFPNDQSFPGGLEEGCFLHRRDAQGMVAIPIRIWFGEPFDPLTGEVMDRSLRWHFEIGGKLYGSDDPPLLGGYPATEDDIARIWPRAGRFPIERTEYDYLCQRRAWAAQNDENDPHGGDIKIDPMTAPLD